MPGGLRLALVAGALFGVALIAHAQQMHNHDMHQHEAGAATVRDDRPIVKFPEELRIHMLANMRDHLLALQEIQDALASQQYDKAGAIAEQRLGMTSLRLHGAHEMAKHMPEGMQSIGSEMHRSASRFAVAVLDTGATGDVRPALSALARVTQQCVACHSAYRVQ
jgi:hypothetical protein